MKLTREECHVLWDESILIPFTRIMYDRLPNYYGIVEKCVGRAMWVKWFNMDNGAFMFTHFLVAGEDEDKVQVVESN